MDVSVLVSVLVDLNTTQPSLFLMTQMVYAGPLWGSTDLSGSSLHSVNPGQTIISIDRLRQLEARRSRSYSASCHAGSLSHRTRGHCHRLI
ncbi:hypothetical protein PROFUN_16917 [Planoprotostelium fungivorum]|uniref:Uncharacterized protein n=1 Tax=Planoprotostelium fungivorum TaxID=1890364 RepID=A0A2P6MND7_9EUKA|nr:hypothetical protein PROFUN_16917 [Planoprotostelium fungivorum]